MAQLIKLCPGSEQASEQHLPVPVGSPSCEVTSLKSVTWNCLVASQYCTVRTTLGRTREALVTMPSTDTRREM